MHDEYTGMNTSPSPYRRGAEAGRKFGFYLSLIFLLMVLSETFALASIGCLALIISLPVILYRSIKRSYIARNYQSNTAELWVEGIMTFLFASIICGLVTMVYLRWIDPDFIVDRIEACIAILRENDVSANRQTIDALTKMVSNGIVPSASQFAIAMFWLTMSGGCILSLIIAAITRHTVHPQGRSDTRGPQTWHGK